jgi:AcrR family transcriptional regulator
MDGYQRRKQQKKESIKQAALELFAVFGVKKTSIAEIAKRADVNPVTVYNHFTDKNALARVIVQDIMAAEWERYKGILSGDLPFQEKLGLIIDAKMKPTESAEHQFIRRVLAEDAGAAELVGAAFEKDINPAIVKFIRTGQKSGNVRDDLSVESIRLYIDMFTDLSRTHPEIFANQPRTSKTAKEIWSLFLFGLLGREDT